MNERIEQLADQCRTEYHDGHGGFTEQFDEEKFAELIVKECARVITNGGYWTDILGNRKNASLDEISQMVKEHFGVEE